MKPTFASVTDELCRCGFLGSVSSWPGKPIVFDPGLNEYNFHYYVSPECAQRQEASYLRIYHCPFCGGAMPESARDKMFMEVSAEEARRIGESLSGIQTFDDALQRLGRPDYEHEVAARPPINAPFQELVYTRLSSTTNVHIIVESKGNIRVSLAGKRIK